MVGRRRDRAAWLVMTRRVDRSDGFADVPLYLLASGRFCYGGDNNREQRAHRVLQIIGYEDQVIAGLNSLARVG